MKIFKTILLFTFFATNAQTIKIIESETFAPISYATVKLYKDTTLVYGNYTNDEGRIDMNSIDYNYVEASCLGFETKKMLKNLIENNTIYLFKKSIQLETVTVTNKKIEFTEIGKNKKRKSITGHSVIGKGYETVQFIENKLNKNTKIISFAFVTEKVRKKTAYRIRVYKKININENNLDIEIPTTNTIYYLEEGSEGLVEVDLTAFDIDFTLDGIYIGLEGLGQNLNENTSSFTKKENSVYIQHQFGKKNRTYLRYTFKNDGWYDIFLRNKIDAKKYGHGDLKVIKEPYFILKVEK